MPRATLAGLTKIVDRLVFIIEGNGSEGLVAISKGNKLGIENLDKRFDQLEQNLKDEKYQQILEEKEELEAKIEKEEQEKWDRKKERRRFWMWFVGACIAFTGVLMAAWGLMLQQLAAKISGG